ncbi:DBH-like monooxygenase protein 1 homolog [Glandiceps talaboti]
MALTGGGRWVGLVVVALSVVKVTVSTSPVDVYPHSAFLDDLSKYQLYWKFDDNKITFEVHVETLGYVGFGISPNGGMANADIVIGWVKDGEVYFTDRFASSNSEPGIDASQDYEILGWSETGTHTILTFSRKFETCDIDDITITEGTLRLIYSYHPDDPESETGLAYHGTGQRGSRSVHLRGVTPTLPEMPTGDDLLTFEFLNPSVSVPGYKDTTYWCQGFNMPTLESKHHMIKYEPVIQAGHEALVHHILIYQCHHEVHEDYDGFGHECYSPNMPDNLTDCATVFISWAIGGEAFYLPEEAGFSLGDVANGDPAFVLMETHYDNPDLLDTFVDSSGIRMYYTPLLRDNDAGVMEVGSIVGPAHIIPPGASEFVTSGHCVHQCLNAGLEGEDITVFASLLHAHLAAVSVKTRHFRNGIEQPLIASDDTYDFNYQEMRYMNEPIIIKPDDDLVTECVYNTEDRSDITYGGLGTTSEMCLHFLYYYPRRKLSICLSDLLFEDVATTLIGEGAELSYTTHPPTITSPAKYAGQQITTILEGMDWSQDQMKKLQSRYDATAFYYCGLGSPDVLSYMYDYTVLEAPSQTLPEPEDVCLSNMATNFIGLTVAVTCFVTALYVAV